VYFLIGADSSIIVDFPLIVGLPADEHELLLSNHEAFSRSFTSVHAQQARHEITELFALRGTMLPQVAVLSGKVHE